MSTDPSANADLFGSGDAGAGVGEFVRSQLPTPPARVLEVGCGSGQLALALSAEGWQMTAVDPEAPEGPTFVRAAVEDLDAADHGPFDAAVAVLSLHHAGVVGTVLDKVRSLLRPGGVLVVDEFRREHLVDRATAAFFYHQQRSLIHAGRKGIDDGGHGGHGDRRSDGGSFESWYAHTLGAHTLGAHTLGRRANIHGERDVLEALEERFVTRRLSYGPYLFRHGLDAAVEPLERMLIAEGGIRATGLRWVGALEAEPPG
jgi:SAM-dependent methyltransferase